MHLTKIRLNPQHPSVLYDIGNAHALHQRVMSGFPDGLSGARQREKVLFYTDLKGFALLVQSCGEPAWSRLPRGYVEDCEIKDVSKVLEHLSAGQVFKFRLRANPSRRDRDSRKIVGINKPEDQIAWLTQHAERNGFVLLSTQVVPKPDIVGFKRKDDQDSWQRITLKCAEFSGTLRVEDVDLFRVAIAQGIGRGRSYGCGLLAIAQ